MRPVQTRFRPCAPSVDTALDAVADLWNVTIVPGGGTTAHVLGLTTQIPVRSVYLTSGPGRRLRFGDLDVKLRHAPRWQPAAPSRRVGEIIRVLTSLGPAEVRAGLHTVLPALSHEDISEPAEPRATMPHWMAESASELVTHG